MDLQQSLGPDTASDARLNDRIDQCVPCSTSFQVTLVPFLKENPTVRFCTNFSLLWNSWYCSFFKKSVLPWLAFNKSAWFFDVKRSIPRSVTIQKRKPHEIPINKKKKNFILKDKHNFQVVSVLWRFLG